MKFLVPYPKIEMSETSDLKKLGKREKKQET